MTTAAQHEADQAAITAACEAGACDHSECNRTPCEVAQAIMDETEANSDDNRRRAARVALAILPAYDDDTAEQGILDAVTDLLHLCDLAGWSFARIEDQARRAYAREIAEIDIASDTALFRALERF